MKIPGKSLGAGALIATLCVPAELGVMADGESSTQARDASAAFRDYRDYLLVAGNQRDGGCASVTVMFVAEAPPTYCP